MSIPSKDERRSSRAPNQRDLRRELLAIAAISSIVAGLILYVISVLIPAEEPQSTPPITATQTTVAAPEPSQALAPAAEVESAKPAETAPSAEPAAEPAPTADLELSADPEPPSPLEPTAHVAGASTYKAPAYAPGLIPSAAPSIDDEAAALLFPFPTASPTTTSARPAPTALSAPTAPTASLMPAAAPTVVAPPTTPSSTPSAPPSAPPK